MVVPSNARLAAALQRRATHQSVTGSENNKHLVAAGQTVEIDRKLCRHLSSSPRELVSNKQRGVWEKCGRIMFRRNASERWRPLGFSTASATGLFFLLLFPEKQKSRSIEFDVSTFPSFYETTTHLGRRKVERSLKTRFQMITCRRRNWCQKITRNRHDLFRHILVNKTILVWLGSII